MSRIGEISTCYTMRFSRDTERSSAELWRAITDSNEVVEWMGMPSARIELRIGGDYVVEFPGDTADALDGVIVRFVNERSLAYVWGYSVLEWVIEVRDQGCRFSFTHHGQPPGLVAQEAGIALGWHLWLDQLAKHLGDSPSRKDAASEDELSQIYEGLFAQTLKSAGQH